MIGRGHIAQAQGRTPQGVRGLKFLIPKHCMMRLMSHPARGAWIEIFRNAHAKQPIASHPARGAWIEIDGVCNKEAEQRESHPARGAWIEIVAAPKMPSAAPRRTPQGVRGLKCTAALFHTSQFRRTPQGVRGLKSNMFTEENQTEMSHPARGAWIEMLRDAPGQVCGYCRTPQGVRGLK